MADHRIATYMKLKSMKTKQAFRHNILKFVQNIMIEFAQILIKSNISCPNQNDPRYVSSKLSFELMIRLS